MLEEWMDTLWFKIVEGVEYIDRGLDIIFIPFNSLGPALAIFGIAAFTVALTKWFSRSFTTNRYRALKEEFQYLVKLREEARTCENTEKGSQFAKNIVQAALNKVYYDYFFEGLLINLLTKYILTLLMLDTLISPACSSCFNVSLTVCWQDPVS